MKTTNNLTALAILTFVSLAGAASGAIVDWTHWSSVTNGGAGSASGTMNGIGVEYRGDVLFGQTGSGTDYWTGPAYINGTVSNSPDASHMVAMVGGTQVVSTITFSQPVTDPIMAIVSMGQTGLAVRYAFDTPFDILGYGQGYWGNGTLAELPADVLEGREGHGTIQFRGTVSSVSWTMPVAENWHGMTVGVIPSPASLGMFGAFGLMAVRRKRA
mgnify:CR=1 FL=1